MTEQLLAMEPRAAAARAAATHVDETVRAAAAMAQRFRSGGTLIVFGGGTLAADAQHVAVEFVHPVIVGKRALPAVALTTDVATLTAVTADEGYDSAFSHRLRLVAGPDDIALGLSTGADGDAAEHALAAARQLGLLTIGIVGAGPIRPETVDYLLPVDTVDPRIAKEVMVTYYHVLWELVHVYLERDPVVPVGMRS